MEDDVLNTLLGRCKSLTKLTLKDVAEPKPIGPIPNLKSFLKSNQALRELELSGGEKFFRMFFEEDLSDAVSFKLKRLEIVNAQISNGEFLERNLLKFLKSQSQSLETLIITHFKSRDTIEHIFNKMPNLKSFMTFREISARLMHLDLNENIVDLGIRGYEEIGDFEKILSVLPKLTKLRLIALTTEKVEAIARKLPNLQTLRFTRGGPGGGDAVWPLLWPNAIPYRESENEPFWTIKIR